MNPSSKRFRNLSIHSLHPWKVLVLLSSVSGALLGSYAPSPASTPSVNNYTDPATYAVSWPTTWSAYTVNGTSLVDDPGDKTNGGAQPSGSGDVSPNGTKCGGASVYFNRDDHNLYFRLCLSSNPYSNNGLYDSATTWSLLVDVDGDGYREYAVVLDGKQGQGYDSGPDNLYVLYKNDNAQSFTDADLGSSSPGSAVLWVQDAAKGTPANTVEGEATGWDVGTPNNVSNFQRTRVTKVPGSGGNDKDVFFLDIQVPLAALDASQLGGPTVTKNTPLAFVYATANSNTDPLQKDFVYPGTFTASSTAMIPFGDTTSGSGTILQPTITQVAATGCNTTTLSSTVQDSLKLSGSTLVSTVSSVKFYYQFKGSNTSPDPAGTWTLIGDGTLQTGSTGTWTVSWNTTGLPQGDYFVKAIATDETGQVTDSIDKVDDATTNANGDTYNPATNGTTAIFSNFQNTCGIPPKDFGDAPDTYGTDLTAGNSGSDPVGPNHIIRSGIRLGTNAPDAETNAQTPFNGTGDGADEDGVSSFPALTTGTNSYSVTVAVTNDPGGNGASGEPSATLTSWIDFDRDGIFQSDEAATVTVADGATSATLTWNNIGSSGPNIRSGNTYARFRLTTDSTITTSTPGGAASDGEVEDYALAITTINTIPSGSCISPGTSPFNTVPYSLNTPLQNSDQLSFFGGSMSFSASLSGSSPPSWANGVQVQNASIIGDHLYLQPTNVPNYLTSGNKATYSFTFPTRVVNFTMVGSGLNNRDGTTIIASYLGVPVPITAANFSNLSTGMELIDADGNGQSDTVASSSSTGGTSVIDNTYSLNIAGPIDTLTVVSGKDGGNSNTGTVTIGLHSFGYCVGTAPNTDYGDAPDAGAGTGVGNYQSTLADGGPRHTIVSGIKLGATVDADSGNLQNTAATGDDADQSTDDEDAFTTLADVRTTGTYSLNNVPVTNTTNKAATLHAWIDFDKDGSFEATEYTSAPVANNATSANLSWPVPSGTTVGTTYARFRLTTQTLIDFSGSANADERSLGPASDGEVEDYQVTLFAEDFGDAPTSLNTVGSGPSNMIDAALTSTYASASHRLDGLTFLGDRVDAETANQPNASATGDDTNTSPNDEDGVTFPLAGTTRILNAGQSNTLTVKASRAGVLNAWFDWNQDGDWDDTGEQVFTNQSLVAGDNDLTVTVPNTAPQASTFARFRFSTASGLGPTGASTNGGEVEDYQVHLVLPAPLACNSGVLNNGFEQPLVPAGNLVDFGNNRVAYRENDVPWWGTIPNSPTANDTASEPPSRFDQRNAIEIWRNDPSSPTVGNPTAFEGSQFAELNAYVPGQLYQDLVLPPGTQIRWQVAHRGRDGTDTFGVLIGAPDNTVSQGNYATPNTEWRVYSGLYTVPSGQYITRFALSAVSTSGGSVSVGNFIDDIRLSNFCPPSTQGYKSVKLMTDADSNNTISPGDILVYTLHYANNAATTTGPAAGFQVNDRLPAGLTIMAAGAQTITVSGGSTSANKNTAYTGATAGAVSDLLGPGALLDVGGTIRIDIPVTVNSDAVGTVLNQGTASATEFVGQTVKTDNVDSTTSGLPSGVTVPTGSVAQQQEVTINPTSLEIINPAASTPNVLLVKRITAINQVTTTFGGDNLAIYNEDSTYPYDDNTPETAATPPDTDKWPNTTGSASSTFLIGGRSGGETKPKDEVEYTIYFLSAGTKDATDVQICDRVPDNQVFVPDAYNTAYNSTAGNTGGFSGSNRGISLEYNGQILALTNDADGDIARFYPPNSTLPAVCSNVVGQTQNNGAVVVNLGNLPRAATPGSPATSYGLIRFRARVK